MLVAGVRKTATLIVLLIINSQGHEPGIWLRTRTCLNHDRVDYGTMAPPTGLDRVSAFQTQHWQFLMSPKLKLSGLSGLELQLAYELKQAIT